MAEKIAVIGLGYVGLPVAVNLGRVFDDVVGYDVNAKRVKELIEKFDSTNEVTSDELKETKACLSNTEKDLEGSTFFIVTVPTPIDDLQRPDLRPLESACKTIASYLKKNDLVVFESTVYPGVTENHCGPLLEKLSGLTAGRDFFLGYSPERISPGDKERTFDKILKIISAQDEKSLARVKAVYGAVVKAGVYEASSIKVAEAAKVIENTQRDVNIALMNELAMIFHRIGISTDEVLKAAGTKWNFLKFSPGLVGGHCIGIDPYYLTTEAERLGYYPHLILSGRRINDSMGVYIAEQLIKKMIDLEMPVKKTKIGVLGLAFKEDVPDFRNSRVPDILRALKEYGPQPIIHDPHVDKLGVQHEYGFELDELSEFKNLDAVIIAVAHKEYKSMGIKQIVSYLKPGGIVVDIKSLFNPHEMPETYHYWSL